MLTDPVSVTVDGSTRSLPRVSGASSVSNPRRIGRSVYRTADGAYTVDIQQYAHRDGSHSSEVMLRKVTLDSSSSTAFDGYIVSGVGLKFETGPYGLGTTDIPAIRSALLAFVDSSLQARVLGGEV